MGTMQTREGWHVHSLSVYSGAPCYSISMPFEKGRHTILVEQDVEGFWAARDACDRGEPKGTLSAALCSYIDESSHANRGMVGHCGWMIETGLPSLRRSLDEIVPELMDLHGRRG